ncbi:acetolactate synthase [Devosia sp. 17-2-E-8]|nr:acetolactate synthase [Devosia sp. 17-2-E-8]
MNANLLPTGSAYFLTQETATPERHTLSVLVDNEPGILARVVGLITARGFNIESLTVSETEHDRRLSRITLVTVAVPKTLTQIKLQLERLVPVHRVHDLTSEGQALERELALIKVKGTGEHRSETLRLADAFRAQVVDATTESFVFEVTGKPSKIDSFIALMVPLGLVEVVRTGLAAISRGPDGM